MTVWRYALAAILAATPAAAELSGYAGQQHRPVKALSEQATADLLAGRGMGYALAAELNRYPGPRHALDLAGELGLSEEQVIALQAVFARMQAEARSLGAAFVEREAALDRLFADGLIDPASLDAETAAIAEVDGRLRRVHLAAHLETRAILIPEQVDRYVVARGYAARAPDGHGGTKHH